MQWLSLLVLSNCLCSRPSVCSVTMSSRQAVICLQTDCHCFSVYSSLMCSVQTCRLICSLWWKIAFFRFPRVCFRSPRLTDSPLHGTRREGYNRGALGKTLLLRSFSFISQSKLFAYLIRFVKLSSKPPPTTFHVCAFRSTFQVKFATCKKEAHVSNQYCTDRNCFKHKPFALWSCSFSPQEKQECKWY